MSLEQKDLETIDHIVKKHSDGVAEIFKRFEDEFYTDDARTTRRIDVLEDMLDIMSER